MPALSIPKHGSLSSACDSFLCYFKDKISLIRSAYSDDNHVIHSAKIEPPQTDDLLRFFTPAAVDGINKITMSSQTSQCDIEPFL